MCSKIYNLLLHNQQKDAITHKKMLSLSRDVKKLIVYIQYPQMATGNFYVYFMAVHILYSLLAFCLVFVLKRQSASDSFNSSEVDLSQVKWLLYFCTA